MLRIDDYALIGDTQTAALVGRNGSIDWMCAPRFDSPACFAALLGDARHGRWLLGPCGEVREQRRGYRGDSLVLETEFVTDTGSVRLVDCMPIRERHVDIVRVVEGVTGEVRMQMDLLIRFDYGSIVPWLRRIDDTLRATAGPDALTLWTPAPTRANGDAIQGQFTVHAGESVPFLLVWHPSYESPHRTDDPIQAIGRTQRWWQKWADRCTFQGEWRDAVVRSLVVLKALTFEPSGGVIAAPTTSLPEQIGGTRNWDYRCGWLRDATFTLYALLSSGYTEEAAAWRNWLLRAVAGDPADLQIMYGVAGERRLREFELEWLPGYAGSRPVRVGNAAVDQLQLDVYGEVIDMLHVARRTGVQMDGAIWSLELALLEFLERAWQKPDEGIWEVRGPRRHFTFSKVMSWVAFDRAIRAAEGYRLQGPVERWRRIRARIHEEVCREGVDRNRQAFTMYYGGTTVDASLLLIPAVGFLPADDPRVAATVAAVERELLHGGLVRRYPQDERSREIDGLPPGEGAFVACTCWLADAYALLGRSDDAARLFQHVLDLRNDLGLLAEQYDPQQGWMLGNFPQAFSHVALVNTAHNLAAVGPSHERARTDDSGPANDPFAISGARPIAPETDPATPDL